MAKLIVLLALLFCVTFVSSKRPFKARDYSAYPRTAGKVEEKKEVGKKSDDGYEYDEEKDEKGEKPLIGKPIGEKPEYKPDVKPGYDVKEKEIIGEKPGLDGGYKPGKLPELEKELKPDVGGYKGIDKHIGQPDIKPDYGGEKPDIKPDLSIGKPGYKPEIEIGKPGYKPEIEIGKPGYKPEIEIGKPGYKPEIEIGKPGYKPEIAIGKPGYKPGIGKPNVDIVPSVFPPKRPYVPKPPVRPYLPPPKRPSFGCGFPAFRPFPGKKVDNPFHRRQFPSFVYRYFGYKKTKKPDIYQKPLIEKPGYDKQKDILDNKPGYDLQKPILEQKPFIEQKPGYEQPKPIHEVKPVIEQKPDYNNLGNFPKEPFKTPDLHGKPQLGFGKPGDAYGKEIKEVKEETFDLSNTAIKEEAKYPPLPAQKGKGY